MHWNYTSATSNPAARWDKDASIDLRDCGNEGTPVSEPPERTALYRLYDADHQLLYIGISKHPEYRWERHSLTQPWWHLVARKSVEWYGDRGSALAAEAETTTAEKPLYDQSWYRNWRNDPQGRFDDSAGVQAVMEGLTLKIQAGELSPGAGLATATVAKEYGVAVTTASKAMRSLAGRDGPLRFRIHGRYFVAER